MISWILVPVRNGLHLTRKAVKTFLAQDLPGVRVMLINNDSSDGTLEWARTLHPQVVTITKTPGLSVTESWNKGLSLLFDAGAEHVLVCNNDVELLLETYRLLLEDGGAFVTGVSQGERDERMGAGGQGKRPHPDFSCFLLRKSVWDSVGQFDEGMAIYCQDGDYHLRMHNAGVAVYCIDLPFYHERSSTLKLASAREQAAILKQADLDKAVFAAKWGVVMGSPEYYAQFAAMPQGTAS